MQRLRSSTNKFELSEDSSSGCSCEGTHCQLSREASPQYDVISDEG